MHWPVIRAVDETESMNSETTTSDTLVETRPVRIVRAVTWTVILAGAAGFWATAGWVAWAYLRP
jgi:hypothetical protein